MSSHFDMVHAQLSDNILDAIAAEAGQATRIGRLSYLTDAMLEGFVDEAGLRNGSRVLDLGCGRGFIGRWLTTHGLDVIYHGVDSSSIAIAAARSHLPSAQFTCENFEEYSAAEGEFDAIFAIEISRGPMSASSAAIIAASLAKAGSALVTIVSLGGDLAELFDCSAQHLVEHELIFECADRTSDAILFATLQSLAWLTRNDLPEPIGTLAKAEATRIVQAIAAGRFQYGTITARTSPSQEH